MTTSHKEKALHDTRVDGMGSPCLMGKERIKPFFKYSERASMCNNEHQEAKLEPFGDCFMIVGFDSS